MHLISVYVCCSLMVDFFNNTLPGFWWNFCVIFIFAWFVNYYIFFVCIIFYCRVFPFLEFVIQMFWYAVGALLVVFFLTFFLYKIFVLQWLMDIYFVFQGYFFLGLLTVFLFRFIIIFIFTTFNDWIYKGGGHYFVYLNTGHLLHSYKWPEWPITDAVIDHVD